MGAIEWKEVLGFLLNMGFYLTLNINVLVVKPMTFAIFAQQ